VVLTYTIKIDADGRRRIICLRCGLSSDNPNDLEQRYCGNCHRFHGDEPLEPVKLCAYCDEPVDDDATSAIETMDGVFGNGEMRQVHRECLVRMIAGSAAHQLGECSCYGGHARGSAGDVAA
jgi:hypothetical protein